MVFMLLMTRCGHIQKIRYQQSADAIKRTFMTPSFAGRSLFPDGVGIQFGWRFAPFDMFIEDGGYVRLRYLGVPRVVGIDDDRRALFAGSKTACPAHQHFSRQQTVLHQPHVECHEQLCGTGAPARRFGVAWGTRIGADKNMILWFRHGFSFYERWQ